MKATTLAATTMYIAKNTRKSFFAGDLEESITKNVIMFTKNKEQGINSPQKGLSFLVKRLSPQIAAAEAAITAIIVKKYSK